MPVAGRISRIEDGTITTAKLVDAAVTNAKLQNDSLTVNGTSIDLGASETITAGKVLQIVHGSTTSQASTTAAAQTASNLSAAITPSSTSNKILVMMSTSIYHSVAAAQTSTTIYRDSTNLGRDDRGIIQFGDFTNRFQANCTMALIDEPNTTSSVTYKLYFRNISAGMGATYIGVDSTPQWVTLMEIAG